MALFLEIKSNESAASRIRLSGGRNRITVRPGESYRIIDDQTGFAPPGTAVKRVDSSIVIDGLGRGETSEEVVVDLNEFYSTCSVSSPCSVLVQQDGGGAETTVTPATQPIGALADGSFVLYDPGYVAPEPVSPEPSDGGWGRVALYGLGGLAIVGLAAGGGGGGGGGGDEGGGDRPDGTLRLSSAPFVNDRKPLVSGQGEPGATITLQIDLDSNNVADVRYQTTVGADGLWSVDLSKASPTVGTLPASGLGDLTSVLVTSNLDGKVASLGPFNLVYDGVPPAPAVIAAIATDNVVNGTEKQAGVTIAGTAEANGSVLVTWAGAQKTAAVNAAGNWTATFAAAEVPADGATLVSAIARDAAGNTAAATTQAVQVDSVPPALQVAAIAGDNLVNAAEAASVVVSGTTAAGAAVSVNWNNIAKPATAAANGSWSVNYAGAEVPSPAEAGGLVFPLTTTATSTSGNVATAAPVQVLVDRIAPGVPVIAAVEGDNVVTVAEAQDGVVISGSGEAGGTLTLAWSGAPGKTATVAANGAWAVAYGANEVPSAPAGGGPTTVSASITDVAGNVGTVANQTVTVVQPFAPPVVSVPIAGDGIVNAAERTAGFNITGTVTPGVPGVTVAITGGPSGAATVTGGTWSFNVPLGSALTQGAHTVSATITGQAGTAGTGSFTLDSVGPPAPVVAAVTADNVVNIAESAGFAITGSAETGATVTLTLGNSTPQSVVATGGTWSVPYGTATLPTLPPAGGAVNLAVSVTDAVGNAGTPASATVTFDLAAPAAPLIAATGTLAANVLTVSGTAEANSAVSVAVAGVAGSPSVVTAAANGSWSALFVTPLTSGSFSVTAVATDAAGNAGPPGTGTLLFPAPVAVDDPQGQLALAFTVGDQPASESGQSSIASSGSASAPPIGLTANPELHPALTQDALFAVAGIAGQSTDGAPGAIAMQSPAATLGSLLWHPEA